VLFNVAKGTEGVLTLPEARIRDNFLKPIIELTQNFYDDREKIYREYCIKNEDGTPALKDGTKYEFNKDKVEQIDMELKTLMSEEVEITAPDTIKEILEKTTYSPKLGEADVIDELLASL